MSRQSFLGFRPLISIILLSVLISGCAPAGDGTYYGKTVAPKDNVLRYISGSEPESLDPQIPTGQPEARVLMALYDGLVEYHPKTMEALPAIAESWEVSADGSEYLFHLRKDAKFSNGAPITARDFVYTFRRGFAPELAAQNAYLGYYIKYAEPYNAGKFFVKDREGNFLLQKDFEEEAAPAEDTALNAKAMAFGPDTEFHRFIKSPVRLTADGDPYARAKEIEGSDKLKAVFGFKAADIKDGAGLAGKLNSDAAAETAIRTAVGKDVLASCTAASCSDETKARIAEGLNAALGKQSLRFAEVKYSESLEKVFKKLDDARKAAEEENAKIDSDLEKLTDATERAALEKKRKKLVDKLFYVNRMIVEEMFPNELGKVDLVPIKGEDLGVEAVDDYTFRLTLLQSAPFFLGLLPHQFFRVVHQPTVEKFGKDWTKPENIVTSGPFNLKIRRPYDVIVTEKNPLYWDAANVKLSGIEFYPMEEATTMMNLYKSGEAHALYNHTPPAAWNEVIREFKDEYLNFPEVAIEYYTFNVKRAPTDDPKVRQAFALAIDREALAKFRKTTKPLVDFTPEGIFPKYEEARTKVYSETLTKQGSSLEQWKARVFDVKRACQMMNEAGYKATMSDNRCNVENFPVDKVNVTYNTAESNKAVAEFMQAQWKQNLGLTIPLKNMEWKTFLPLRKAVDYNGIARAGWVGDYMDPFTFLALFYKENNDSSTGWHDPKFDKMLDDANKELDEMKRFEKLAEAELYMMQNQPVLPLQTQATNWIKKPYVKGLYPNPGTLHAWKFVYIEQDRAKWDRNVDNIMTDKDPVVETQVETLFSSQKAFADQKKSAAAE